MISMHRGDHLVEDEVFFDKTRSPRNGEQASFDAVHVIAVAVELLVGEALRKTAKICGIGRVDGAAEDVAQVRVGSPKRIVDVLPEAEGDEGFPALIEDALDEVELVHNGSGGDFVALRFYGLG